MRRLLPLTFVAPLLSAVACNDVRPSGPTRKAHGSPNRKETVGLPCKWDDSFARITADSKELANA